MKGLKMLKKLCACGNKININQKSCTVCEQKRKEYIKHYDKTQRKNKDIYHSKMWSRLTKLCKERFNSLDIYVLYEHGEIRKGTLSHHIIEIDEDRSKAFDLDNLIFLSDRSHAEIHIEYSKGEKEKKLMQNKLQAYVERYVG
ncbi:hypothetical protein [Filifactor alocis]|uniref:hypothetical protein n=1 Tax=Filifactor alocis TaxID=143361 RepID=UPI003FA0DA83